MSWNPKTLAVIYHRDNDASLRDLDSGRVICIGLDREHAMTLKQRYNAHDTLMAACEKVRDFFKSEHASRIDEMRAWLEVHDVIEAALAYIYALQKAGAESVETKK